MRKPTTVKSLENFGRIRLSQNFFMRDFLHSEISQITGIANIPDDPDLAVQTGRHLCEELLEPLNATFGRIHVRSALRSAEVNAKGAENKNQYNCSKNENTFGNHIWDRRDKNGNIGACACIVVPWFLDHYEEDGDWRPLAWWIHDHLNYSEMYFFPKLCAFNLTWSNAPKRTIKSFIPPRGLLTKPVMANHTGNHKTKYPGFPEFTAKVKNSP